MGKPGAAELIEAEGREVAVPNPGKVLSPDAPAYSVRPKPGAREPPRAPPSALKSKPLIEIGRSGRLEEAMAGLKRGKARHPGAAAHLEPAVLVTGCVAARRYGPGSG